MTGSLYRESLSALEGLAKALDLSEAMRSAFANSAGRHLLMEPSHCPIIQNWPVPLSTAESKLLDHCLIYTRAYAILENFVNQRLISLLSILERNYLYNNIPKETQDGLRRGTADILSNISKERYANISEMDVSQNYATAIVNGRDYKLIPEAILRNEQNYRLAEISRLFRICGISGFDQWADQYDPIREFFESQSRQPNTLEGYLRLFISYRNSAAHGYIDEISSGNLLREVIDFIKAVIDAVYRRVQIDILQRFLDLGIIRFNGYILESYRNGAAVVSWNTDGVSVGDTIAIGKGLNISLQQIREIQFDSRSVQYARGSSHMELGFRFDQKVRVGQPVYAISDDADVSVL